jgi:hypothetical protein
VPFDCRYQYVHGHDACVASCPTRAPDGTFAYERVDIRGQAPAPADTTLDLAVLDMNHGWPNLGHDAAVHSVRLIACDLREALHDAGLRLRVTSYDVRRRGGTPVLDDAHGTIVIGTGGPGHIDPRRNDGIDPGSQGILEDPAWERDAFAMFAQVLAHPEGVLLGICHTFGVMCRWLGVATPVLRGPEKGGKSAGLKENVLTPEALAHPWFRHLAAEAGPRIEVLDSRLYDLVAEAPLPASITAIGYETLAPGGPPGPALTMMELARDVSGLVPRVLAVNHHPEVVNRPRQLALLRRRWARGDIEDAWYQERRRTLMETLDDRDGEQLLTLTSSFTFHGPLRYHITRHLRLLAERLRRPWTLHECEVPLAMTRAGLVVSIAELGVPS